MADFVVYVVVVAPVEPDLIGQPVFRFLFEVAFFQPLPALFLQAQAVPQVVQKLLKYICRAFLFHSLHLLTKTFSGVQRSFANQIWGRETEAQTISFPSYFLPSRVGLILLHCLGDLFHSHVDIEIHPITITVEQVGVTCAFVRVKGIRFHYFGGFQ